MFFEPKAAYRHVKVTQRRTKQDFVHCMKWLVNEAYPDATVYDTFATAEANRLAHRLEFHYTPKHGSWLNIAEIELSVLHRQCLKARIPDQPTLISETTAWYERRNHMEATMNWRFTTDDVRIKLHRLYPTINVC